MAANNKKPKLTYEPEADVLTWEISSRGIDHAKEIGNMVVHFSKSNTPVLVKILEASRFIAQSNKLIKHPAQTRMALKA